MTSKEHTDILNKYLAGEISLEQLSDIVDDRLFALRTSSPELTEESEFLAGIELIIEEVKDGFRSVADLVEYIRSLVQSEESVIPWKVILSDTSATSSASITSEAVTNTISIPVPSPAFA